MSGFSSYRAIPGTNDANTTSFSGELVGSTNPFNDEDNMVSDQSQFQPYQQANNFVVPDYSQSDEYLLDREFSSAAQKPPVSSIYLEMQRLLEEEPGRLALDCLLEAAAKKDVSQISKTSSDHTNLLQSIQTINTVTPSDSFSCNSFISAFKPDSCTPKEVTLFYGKRLAYSVAVAGATVYIGGGQAGTSLIFDRYFHIKDPDKLVDLGWAGSAVSVALNSGLNVETTDAILQKLPAYQALAWREFKKEFMSSAPQELKDHERRVKLKYSVAACFAVGTAVSMTIFAIKTGNPILALIGGGAGYPQEVVGVYDLEEKALSALSRVQHLFSAVDPLYLVREWISAQMTAQLEFIWSQPDRVERIQAFHEFMQSSSSNSGVLSADIVNRVIARSLTASHYAGYGSTEPFQDFIQPESWSWKILHLAMNGAALLLGWSSSGYPLGVDLGPDILSKIVTGIAIPSFFGLAFMAARGVLFGLESFIKNMLKPKGSSPEGIYPVISGVGVTLIFALGLAWTGASNAAANDSAYNHDDFMIFLGLIGAGLTNAYFSALLYLRVINWYAKNHGSDLARRTMLAQKDNLDLTLGCLHYFLKKDVHLMNFLEDLKLNHRDVYQLIEDMLNKELRPMDVDAFTKKIGKRAAEASQVPEVEDSKPSCLSRLSICGSARNSDAEAAASASQIAIATEGTSLLGRTGGTALTQEAFDVSGQYLNRPKRKCPTMCLVM